MILSNKKVDQINSNSEICLDYGEILSPSEIKEIICDHFSNLNYIDGNLYGEYENKKYCIYFKNVSYLGNPHAIYKKRIQISNNFINLYKENQKNNIETLLIGVYKYKDNILICDFKTDSYIKRKAHNSSAHVYSIDLLNGQRNGIFKKKDIRGNVITVFNKNNVERYLKDKLLSENGSIEIFNTLDEFFASITKEWFGIDCYMEMIENNFPNKFQPEWPGFYLEFKLNQYLENNHKTDVVLYSQNKKKGEIDLDLFFPREGFYGDLKAHSLNSTGIQGNDYETVMNLIEKQSIYYIVCNHTTEKDKDHNFEVTHFWNEKQNKSNIDSYGNKMKNKVFVKSYYVLELNKYNKQYIDIFNQGINSDGKPRKPKISIAIKNINNFLVHVLDFEEEENN